MTKPTAPSTAVPTKASKPPTTQARPSRRPVKRPTMVGGMESSKTGQDGGTSGSQHAGGAASPPLEPLLGAPGRDPAESVRGGDEPNIVPGVAGSGQATAPAHFEGRDRPDELLRVTAEVGV